MTKSRWIPFFIFGLLFSVSLHAEKNYLDYLNEVKEGLATAESDLAYKVKALGMSYADIRDDDDFDELKTKTVLLWVVRECIGLAQTFIQQPDTLGLVPSTRTLSDFKLVAKERANEGAMRALNLSVEASRLEFSRQELTAALFLERMRGDDSATVLGARSSLENEIEDLLYKELDLHESIPMAYIEAALHVAISARISEDMGDVQKAEEASAAFGLLIDSASTAYANALAFFGRTRMDSDLFARGLDAIDAATIIHANALEAAEAYL